MVIIRSGSFCEGKSFLFGEGTENEKGEKAER